jgi:hypothetical protein
MTRLAEVADEAWTDGHDIGFVTGRDMVEAKYAPLLEAVRNLVKIKGRYNTERAYLLIVSELDKLEEKKEK